MELKEMTLQDVEARLSEMEGIVETSENVEEVNALAEEKRALLERKEELAALEERKTMAEEIQTGKTDAPVELVEERKGEVIMKDVKEFRNSAEYINAYAEYIKTGKDEEVRALLTTNVGEAGTIAVPDFVYDEVKTAWDRNEIMALVPKQSMPGNIKVQFEISAGDAVIHNEGSGAVSEEELVEGIATLVPQSVKKWISITDEVMDLRGQAFLSYIYRELTHKITKKLADILVGKIAALPSSATATTPCAATVKVAPAMATVSKAIGNLSDEASNPVIVMNKLTYAEFKTVQYANGYGADPFEGLEIRYNNTLPAYSAASENDVYMIVGDFGYGALANFPNGEGITFKFDELSKKKEDLVEILGREYVAVEPVACKAFTLVTKPAAL